LGYSHVFGDGCQAKRAASTEPEETQFQQITQQRAARRALASTQTQASTPLEEQAAEDGDWA